MSYAVLSAGSHLTADCAFSGFVTECGKYKMCHNIAPLIKCFKADTVKTILLHFDVLYHIIYKK